MSAKVVEIKSYPPASMCGGSQEAPAQVEITLKDEAYGIEYALMPMHGDDRIGRAVHIAETWLCPTMDIFHLDKTSIFKLLTNVDAVELRRLCDQATQKWRESYDRLMAK